MQTWNVSRDRRFNRPKTLNSFGGNLMPEVIRAIHEAEAIVG